MVICVTLLIYSQMKISSLQETIGELNTELVATKANLLDAEASYKSAKETINYNTVTITNTKEMLKKCHMDLSKTVEAYREIDDIMHTADAAPVPKYEISTSISSAPENEIPTIDKNVTTVTDYQTVRGLQFMNKQLSRLDELRTE